MDRWDVAIPRPFAIIPSVRNRLTWIELKANNRDEIATFFLLQPSRMAFYANAIFNRAFSFCSLFALRSSAVIP